MQYLLLPLLLSTHLLGFQAPAIAVAAPVSQAVQLPDPQVLAQAIAQGKLKAVETYAAMYQPDLNQAIAIRPDLSLRPISIALSHLHYAQRSQMTAFTPLARERDMLKLLLKLNATPNYQEPDLGLSSPLHLIFDLPVEDQQELAELLFQYQGEANLIFVDSQQRTPLELAKQKQSPLAAWLDKYKPRGLLDFQIRYAPFALAQGQTELKQMAQQQALINALQKGHLDKLKALLSTQSPDLFFVDGQPLLHAIVLDQRLDLLSLWQAAEADLDLSDLEGQTALHLAAKQGKIKMLKALLAAGAAINIRDQARNTALHLAVIHQQPESVRALLAAQARWDLPNLAGQTPWQLAQTRWQADPTGYGELYLVFQAFIKESPHVPN